MLRCQDPKTPSSALTVMCCVMCVPYHRFRGRKSFTPPTYYRQTERETQGLKSGDNPSRLILIGKVTNTLTYTHTDNQSLIKQRYKINNKTKPQINIQWSIERDGGSQRYTKDSQKLIHRKSHMHSEIPALNKITHTVGNESYNRKQLSSVLPPLII